jgi:hypothetical protein
MACGTAGASNIQNSGWREEKTMDTRQLKNGNVLMGLALIVLGLVFLAVTQGAFNLSWGNFWPLIPMIVGAFLLLQAFVTEIPARRAGLVIGGTIALLTGAFFFATTTGILDWSDQGRFWPVYPLIVGVAFLAAYLATGMTFPGYLIPAGILIGVGLVFGAILLTGTSFAYIGKLWPIALIIIGVLMLAQRLWVRQAR